MDPRQHEYANSLRDFHPKNLNKKVSTVHENGVVYITEILEYYTLAGMIAVVAIGVDKNGQEHYVLNRPNNFRVI